MGSIVNGKKRSHAATARKLLDALLDLRLELSLLNQRVAIEVGLNDVDLDCLEILSREGPTSPARLTRRLGIHPATMTGILTRLEGAGWISRSTHPDDRRASLLRIPAKREARLQARYAAATRAALRVIGTRSTGEVAKLAGLLGQLSAAARLNR